MLRGVFQNKIMLSRRGLVDIKKSLCLFERQSSSGGKSLVFFAKIRSDANDGKWKVASEKHV